MAHMAGHGDVFYDETDLPTVKKQVKKRSAN